MPSVLSQLLRRPPGSGWLILSGGSMPEDLIPRTLALIDHAGSIAVLVPSTEYAVAAESALQIWTDISGWNGRVVDCGSPEAVEEALSEAALILLPDQGGAEAYHRALGQTDSCEYLLVALDGGAVIVSEGSAAEALGELMLSADGGSAGPALQWIPGAVIQTHFSGQHASPAIFKRKDLFRIGLPEGVAIALGPGEEREIWGGGKPTLTFREWWKS